MGTWPSSDVLDSCSSPPRKVVILICWFSETVSGIASSSPATKMATRLPGGCVRAVSNTDRNAVPATETGTLSVAKFVGSASTAASASITEQPAQTPAMPVSRTARGARRGSKALPGAHCWGAVAKPPPPLPFGLSGSEQPAASATTATRPAAPVSLQPFSDRSAHAALMPSDGAQRHGISFMIYAPVRTDT